MTRFLAEFNEDETAAIEEEFRRVGSNIYLDHAGTTLYSERQVDAAAQVLKDNLFCNPHTCKVTGDLIDQVRYRILKHFNTDATEYAVVFTANATAALKLVAENFAFKADGTGSNGGFYYCQENHTSVLGMRELVQTERMFVLTKDEMLENLSEPPKPSKTDTPSIQGNSLLAFSAQCNFSGYKMPLSIINRVQTHGLMKHGLQLSGRSLTNDTDSDNSDFFVCLDTASFVASNFLDLQKYKPDFCCISFYKMFGYPTGVGALLVSKRGQRVLKKRYYGGGTVKIAMTRENFHEKRDGFAAHFEDGTLPFLSIASLLEGFRTVERLVPSTETYRSVDRISKHVYQLAKYCHDYLAGLRHANGAPLIKFYNHTDYKSVDTQGGIISFNLLHEDGSYVGFAEVACIAAVHNIQLRTGCFCNSGACQWFLEQSNTDIRKQYEAGHVCSDFLDLVEGQPTGAVRMSFGYMTKLGDVQRALDVLKDCYLSRSTLTRRKIIDINEKRLPKVLQNVTERFKPQIRKLCIYPVKSCGSFEITGDAEWRLVANGFQFDRNWMIVDANGMAMTQKHHTRLCLIKPQISIESNYLELEYPGMKSCRVPLEWDEDIASDQKIISTSFCQSKVCNDLVDGHDCGEAVADWLSQCLETDGLRLIRQYTARRRSQNGETKHISLANQAQFLLINRRSVEWLAKKVENETEELETTVDRFRANIVIDTIEAFEENDFEEVRIGDLEFTVDGFCTRCQMICIDQHSGQKTMEPLRTIAKEFKGKIRFGIYLSLRNKTKLPDPAIIRCNQHLKILKYKDIST